ncbi:MAG: AzlD domain-containing protein [Eubacteriales bacterium]
MNNQAHVIGLMIVMAGVTYLVRAVPFVLFRKKIENRFIRSFLGYIPYAVLAAMTVPAVLYSTDHIYSALCGLAVALVMAFFERGLVTVALSACAVVYLAELLGRLL